MGLLNLFWEAGLSIGFFFVLGFVTGLATMAYLLKGSKQ